MNQLHGYQLGIQSFCQGEYTHLLSSSSLCSPLKDKMTLNENQSARLHFINNDTDSHDKRWHSGQVTVL